MNTKQLLRSCPICGSDRGEVLYAMNFNLLDNAVLPNKFDVVACANCGFVFNDSSAVQDDYDRHYSCNSIYESTNLNGLGGSNDNHKFTDIFERISPFLSDGQSIVDVGTAQGGMLDVLRDKGFIHLHAMDLSDTNSNALEERGIVAWRNSICDVESVGRKFDFVILSHILEHVYDLKTAVCNIKRLLNDDCLAYIEVPNANKYFEQYPEAPFHFFNIEHINHFDSNSLENLFKPHGFEIVQKIETTFADSTINYPVMGIIVRNISCRAQSAPTSSRVEFTRNGCKDNVMAYVSRCANDMDRINKVFSSIKERGSPCIIWGAGMYAQWLLKNSSLASCDIKFFVDKAVNKHGRFVNGIEIKPIDILLESSFNRKNTAIIITAAIYKVQILDEIKSMKLECSHYVV